MTVSTAAELLEAGCCLDLLPERWKGRLIESGQARRLSAAAAMLPPIPRLGLEIWLGPAAGRVDLHQLISADPTEQAVLLHHFECRAFGGSVPAGLMRFLHLWGDPDRPIGAAFPHLYLEFDQRGDAGPDFRFPCLFLDVHRRLGAGALRQRREDVTLGVVEEVFAIAGRAVPAALATCFHAVPPTASIGHLGLMFGREESWVRLNIKQLERGMLLPLLAAIDWHGDRTAADILFTRLLDQADRVTVALDLRDEWQKRIGFEVFFEHPPVREPRWNQLLEWFCQEGLATTEEGAALLDFPAAFEPGPTGPGWPAPWIAAAAIAPRDHVPRFKRYLSHLKISLGVSGEREAKAYLGMIHDWQILTAPQSSQAEAPSARASITTAPGPSGDRSTQIGGAITAGCGYLSSRMNQGGFWRDFQLQIGFGDEWVTAFIACQLLDAGVPEGRTLAERALAWLQRRQRPGGGWGFNGAAPPDADSTAWVLQLAGRLGADESSLQAARSFLAQHFLPSGGVSTYASTTPLRFADKVLRAEMHSGWSGAHDCVTANAARFMPSGSIEWLRRRQSADGSWRAYWWSTDVFATALAAEALHDASPVDNAAQIANAVAWAWTRRSCGESAFDRSQQLRLATLACDRMSAGQTLMALDQLMAQQRPDGGWPSGAPMLFAQPWETERTAGGARCLDQDGCFSTAAVVGALGKAARAIASGRLQ